MSRPTRSSVQLPKTIGRLRANAVEPASTRSNCCGHATAASGSLGSVVLRGPVAKTSRNHQRVRNSHWHDRSRRHRFCGAGCNAPDRRRAFRETQGLARRGRSSPTNTAPDGHNKDVGTGGVESSKGGPKCAAHKLTGQINRGCPAQRCPECPVPQLFGATSRRRSDPAPSDRRSRPPSAGVPPGSRRQPQALSCQ